MKEIQSEENSHPKIIKKFQFKFFPEFADFLLKNNLREFTKQQLRFMFEVDFPILKHYDFSIYTEEQLIELSLPTYSEFLNAVIENKLEANIDEAIKRWVTNQLTNITRDQLVIEDILLATYIRKKVFLVFLPSYTSDINLAIELIKEIDDYCLEAYSKSFHIYIDINNEKVEKINETLKKHETDLLEAQEIASFGSFEWNLVGEKSEYTPQVQKIFEMDQNSTLSDFLEYVHPGDKEKLQVSIDNALAGKQDYECEYRYRKNGKEKVLWTKGLVSFEDGKPIVMKGTVMDITDRHYMLKRLERNEELYKQAQKLTHIGNWTWEIATNKIMFSDELYRIYGLTIGEEITFDRFISFIHPEDKEQMYEQLKESSQTGVGHELDFRIIREDGSTRIIRRNTEVFKDDKGKPYKVSGTGQDITKEIFLDKEIKEREEDFGQLIKNAPDTIIVIDEASKVLLWNPKASEIFGLKSDEAIGKNLTNLIIPERYQLFHKNGMDKLLEVGKKVSLNKTIEVIAKNALGIEFYISLTISQSLQKGKTVFITFIRDISYEKKIKAELEIKTEQLAELNVSLEQKNIALEKSNKELTSFSYVASHDLQEPLRKIKTFSNLLLEKEKNMSEDGKVCFDRIIFSVGRMQKLIDDLLTFSRTEIYEKTLKSVDLNLVLSEIKTLHNEAIKEDKLVITSNELPVIHAVPFQIQQLFENIISNSIKYSKTGKRTEVNISSKIINDEDDALFLSSVKSRNFHKISISDNGIGFDQKYSEKIFEIFQRLHGKNEYSGTGIGLSICKKIVENHKGFIYAHSKINEGATFEIYLPI
jgi:PAS domain S-box-containing protein